MGQFAATQDDSIGERLLYWYLTYTPVLWILGLLWPASALILLRLFVQKVIITRVGLVVWAWWTVGLLQAVCVVVNWIERGLPFSELAYRLSSAPVIGWFALGTALAIGKTCRLSSTRVIRGVCILGLYLLVLGVLSLIITLITRSPGFEMRSPLAFVLPEKLPSISTLFTARFVIIEETLGSELPRLILFYPWSVCLGFAGIAVIFIAVHEQITFWKSVGMLGGFVAVVGSMSRAAIGALVLVSCLYVWKRLPPTWRLLSLLVVCAAALMLIVFALPVSEIFTRVSDSISGLRTGSSEARRLGYDEAWLAFLRSPIFGNGWPGEFLDENIPMPVGSHSTVYGLLYTGGAIVFIPFIAAMGLTVAAMYRSCDFGTGVHRSALSITVALAILCYGEGIYSFVLPTLFAFCWMGGSLGSWTLRFQKNSQNNAARIVMPWSGD